MIDQDRAVTGSVLVRQARLVPVGTTHVPPTDPVDLRVVDGVVREVAPALRRDPGEELVEADGRWLVPGLWDAHVHMLQWALTFRQLDVSGTDGPDEVVRLVGEHVASTRDEGAVVGFGYRSATWPRPATVAELDAVAGGRPVVLVSGDGHNGWLSSRALELLGVPARDGVLEENDWFEVFARLDELPGADEGADAAYQLAVDRAAARGVVGIVDFEFGRGYAAWPGRVARGIDRLRVRASTYPDGLDEVVTAGWRTGDPLPGAGGLVRMGPLKIISDGSLNTRTAYCHEPYADAGSMPHPQGKQNYSPDQLVELLTRAQAHHLEVAVHAIGDAAVAAALETFEATGARGSIEHAQLLDRSDLDRMARLGIRASVQPAHLLDDRDVAEQCWPDRMDRCFLLRSLSDAGVRLTLGSDAPVSPLDPWTAMAAAVHRSADEREAWNPAEAITASEALAASTDGHGTPRPGSPGDLVLLDHDPLQPSPDPQAVAAHLRTMPVAATVVAGRTTHSTL